MVAIKLETKVGRGKASPITATINSWTGYADTKRCFSERGQELLEILRFFTNISTTRRFGIEGEFYGSFVVSNSLDRFSIPSSSSSFLPLKMPPSIYHMSTLVFVFFYSRIIFLETFFPAQARFKISKE